MLKPQVQAVVTVSCFVVENYVDLKIVQVLAFMFYYNVNMKILKLELMLQIQFLLWGRKAPESRFCLCFSLFVFFVVSGHLAGCRKKSQIMWEFESNLLCKRFGQLCS